MARFKLSLNEGSLVRRTVLHVAAFVLGTAAFLALASFLLVTIMKGLLPSEKEKSASASGDDASEEASSSTPGASSKPSLRPPRKKRGSAPTPTPTEEDDQ